jgi:hypothetical protein
MMDILISIFRRLRNVGKSTCFFDGKHWICMENSLFLFTILFLGEIYCSIFGRVFLGDKENESGNLEGKLCPQ